MRKRIGPWVQTRSGRAFYPLDARPDDIDILDISHALGFQCRFNGHTRHFYSVAEHSVLLSLAVAPDLARWALMHDAAEAYVGDIIRPIKQALPVFKAAEEITLQAIAQAFGLSWPIPEEINGADLALLAAERLPIMGPSESEWDLRCLPLDDVRFRFWGPERAAREFLARFYELWPERHPAAEAAERSAA
ncbi:MAG: phosphohydrolase [Thermodesulfobacteriota bacterium]